MSLEKFFKKYSLDFTNSVGCPAELYTFPPLPHPSLWRIILTVHNGAVTKRIEFENSVNITFHYSRAD